MRNISLKYKLQGVFIKLQILSKMPESAVLKQDYQEMAQLLSNASKFFDLKRKFQKLISNFSLNHVVTFSACRSIDDII